MRYVAVVDGEHYPPVVESALADLEASGHEVLAAVMAGGTEKIPSEGLTRLGRVPVLTGDDPRAVLDRALSEIHPDAVLDLSDEPVLDYRRRHQLVAVALWREVAYEGADFRFSPPPRPRLARKPSIAVIGTGKRTGKTAVAAFAARSLVADGRRPIVVAMGRGGPPDPEVLRGDQTDLGPDDLMALADAGKHAASDYVEDALLARVPTVGCRRCGGGLAGAVGMTNVPEGIEIANRLEGDIMLLEGSGSAMPPAHADVVALVVPATIPEEYLAGYLGPYRLLLSDFAIVTMCENPFVSPSQVSAVTSLLRRSYRPSGDASGPREELRVVRTVFRPAPTRDIEGASVFVATTAPEAAGQSIRQHLEGEYRCRVVGITHSLSDRKKLMADLKAMRGADLLLCEIKAAAVDVATRQALGAGLEVAYMDNVPIGIDGDDPPEMIRWAAEEAFSRFEG